ncbi:hypothetical protein G6F43_005404 [Rhizopus delemar]|nr:hypothetical protein G6F43_005404 [Rhizopus delemar]
MNKALIGIDPLFLNDVKILIKDISRLVPMKYDQVDVFQYYRRLIKYVEVCGVVIAISKNSFVTTITIDDSTGTIDCDLWNDRLNDNIELGSTVRAIGKINQYREAIQITFSVRDVNYELLHLCQAIYYKSEYEKPLILPPEIREYQDQLTQQLAKETRDMVDYLNILNDEPELSEESFKKTLLKYIEQLDMEQFSVSNLRHVPELLEMATQIHQKLLGDTHITNKKMMNYIMNMTQRLVKEGNLEQIDSITFKLLNEELLKNKIIEIIHLSNNLEGQTINNNTNQPTTTSGSVAYTSYPTLTSVDLQNANFSGLYATNIPTTTKTTKAILNTQGSSSTFTLTTLSPSSTAIKSNTSSLSATDSGVIIGGSVAGVIVFIGLTLCACCMIMKRRRQPKHFNTNRMLFTHADQPPFTMVSQEKELPQPVPRMNNNKTTPNGARLSKYNYLSQAFSQMRNAESGDVKLPARDSTIDAYFMKNLEMVPPPPSHPSDSHQSLAVSSVSDVSKYSTNIQPYLQQTFQTSNSNKYQYI